MKTHGTNSRRKWTTSGSENERCQSKSNAHAHRGSQMADVVGGPLAWASSGGDSGKSTASSVSM